MVLLPTELTTLAEALEATLFRFVWSLDKLKQQDVPDEFAERTRGNGVVVPPNCGAGPPGAPHLCDALWVELGAGGCRSWGAARVLTVLRGPKAQREVEVEGGRLTKEKMVGALEEVIVGEEGKNMKRRAELLMVIQ